MTTDDSIFLIYDRLNTSERFRMTRMKTAVFLAMFISSCGLILSITDALPTPEPDALQDDNKITNNSRLVITHVVKTIEFEVGLVDDVSSDDNSTDSDASEFYETDIQLLNVDLLKEVVNRATGEDNWEGTMGPPEEQQQTVDEENAVGQLYGDSFFPLNSTTS